MNGGVDDGAQRNSSGVFLGQQAVEQIVGTERTNHMVRIASQPVTTQHLQVLELLPHALRCLVAVVPAIAEELADQPQPCVTLFVKIDLRMFHAEDAKVDATPDCSDLRQDVMT